MASYDTAHVTLHPQKQMTTPSNTPHIRAATADDAARMRAIARTAYAKYVPRIGREPLPMDADYEAEVAANRAVVIETAGSVLGYMIAWPEPDAYLIDNIGVDPAAQGGGLGRCLINHAVSQTDRLGLPALRLFTNALMSENLAMYAHIGFVETHRSVEKGFHRVYMRWILPNGAR
jgi:GNAT superfamily N-acetyltransferase